MKKLLRYSAFVLGLILGLFFFLMSLDSFPHVMEKRAVLGFLIHIIPCLVTVTASIFSFRHPKAGFVVFLVLTTAFTVYFRTYSDIQNFMVISMPLLVITLLLFSSIQNKVSK